MRFLGRASELPAGVQQDMQNAEEKTASNGGMVLCLALNYGGRAEIVDSINALLAERRAQGNNVAAITEDDLSSRLYTNGLPDPDLLIRTSGEMRVSNFLLWQIAYAELFVTETLWPDFNRARLLESFVEFQKRERRYGGIGEGGSDSDMPARVAGE
jgi:undecaprenyl diphosphate synthase